MSNPSKPSPNDPGAPRPGIPASGPRGAAAPSAAGGPQPITLPKIHATELANAPASDPDMRAIAESLARAVGEVDPETSIEVLPPSQLQENRAKDPYIGTTFDHRYKIEQLLGEGGMGFVYLARHKVIDKKVAVKVLRAEMAREREILDRFLQEAKAASSIGNPHIIDISDFGELPDGSTYFVMEYLDGRSLSQIVDANERVPVDRICHIALQIADGLSAAHERGIVHRDLKPDNIFVVTRGTDKDFVKILDFGIAKVTNSTQTKLTKAGAVFGTPHYMSPEQAAGAPLDHRTDVYSLGVMLYEMAAGQLPFNADNFMGILTQHMYKAPVPIRALVPTPDCPPALEAVILKCLSKKPEGRYQTMAELSADLEAARQGGVPKAVAEMMARSGGFNVPADFFKQQAIVPATPPPPQRAPWPRYVWMAGALAAVGLAVVIVVKGSTTDASPPPRPPEPAAAAPPAAPAPTAAEAAATAAPTAAPETKKITVGMAATPETAVALRDGKELKLPAAIDVEEGKPVTIEVRAQGFESQTVTLDGKQPSMLVKLIPSPSAAAAAIKPVAPVARPAPVAPAAPAPVRKKTGDVVDPWK